MNPKLYRKQIAETGIEDMIIDVSSLQSAMRTMEILDDLERVLKKIKFNLHLDIRNIRVEYMKKMQEVDEQSKKPKKMFSRKPSVESIIKKKKAIKKERNMNISAYEIIEDMVEGYLSQIDEARRYIKNHIQKKVQ